MAFLSLDNFIEKRNYFNGVSLRSAFAGSALRNDVKWPTVWSIVNRCFHGTSNTHMRNNAKNSIFSLEKNHITQPRAHPYNSCALRACDGVGIMVTNMFDIFASLGCQNALK